MKLIRFTDEARLDEYLQVLGLSCLRESPVALPIPISLSLKNEIACALKYTQSVADDFKWIDSTWVLYAVLNEANEIIGTVVATAERHAPDCVNIEYVAIRQKEQGQGIGRFMMSAIMEEIRRHGNERYVLLTTGDEGPFYESIGMDFAGEIVVGDIKRRFYSQKIR